MEAFLDQNWLSEAISEASPIKYANEEGSESIDNHPPPIEIFQFWTPV